MENKDRKIYEKPERRRGLIRKEPDDIPGCRCCNETDNSDEESSRPKKGSKMEPDDVPPKKVQFRKSYSSSDDEQGSSVRVIKDKRITINNMTGKETMWIRTVKPPKRS